MTLGLLLAIVAISCAVLSPTVRATKDVNVRGAEDISAQNGNREKSLEDYLGKVLGKPGFTWSNGNDNGDSLVDRDSNSGNSADGGSANGANGGDSKQDSNGSNGGIGKDGPSNTSNGANNQGNGPGHSSVVPGAANDAKGEIGKSGSNNNFGVGVDIRKNISNNSVTDIDTGASNQGNGQGNGLNGK